MKKKQDIVEKLISDYEISDMKSDLLLLYLKEIMHGGRFCPYLKDRIIFLRPEKNT